MPNLNIFSEDEINLGRPSIGDWWGMTVKVENEAIPIMFSKEQALEIARRINEHYNADL